MKKVKVMAALAPVALVSGLDANGHPVLAVLAAVALVVVGVPAAILAYMVSCQIRPYRLCPDCESGKRFSADRKTFRACPACKGAGKHVRRGYVWAAVVVQRIRTRGEARSA